MCQRVGVGFISSAGQVGSGRVGSGRVGVGRVGPIKKPRRGAWAKVSGGGIPGSSPVRPSGR